ncbi:MAG TPA: hypothetical protein VMF69_05990 [Gemmataceae bacterium]|nr:hypothetical protein [Gemmataceae bacterium]
MKIQIGSVAPHPVVPTEVLAFAREQGVEKYLTELIEWTRQVYPSATRFDVFTEDDPEIPDRYIVFELDAPLTVEQSLEADDRWGEGWLRIYPYPRTCIFRKSVRLP